MEYSKKEPPFYFVDGKGWLIDGRISYKKQRIHISGQWYKSKIAAKRDYENKVADAKAKFDKAEARAKGSTWETFLRLYQNIRLTEVKESSWYVLKSVYLTRFDRIFTGWETDRVFSKEGASLVMREMINAKTHAGAPLSERRKNRGVEEFRRMAEYACDRIACISLSSYQEVRRGLWKIKAANPAPKAQKIALTEEQADRLVDYAYSEANCALERETAFLTEFLLATFMRIGEALALEVKDFDPVRRVVHISKTITVSLSGSWVKGSTPKTSSSIRDVPVSKPMAKELACWIKEFGLFPENALFFGTNGGRLDGSAYRKRLKALCQGAGVPVVSPHELRHTGITLARGRLLESDGDMGREAIAEMAGHSLAVEDQTYVHATEEMKRRLAKA